MGLISLVAVLSPLSAVGRPSGRGTPFGGAMWGGPLLRKGQGLLLFGGLPLA